MKFSGKPEQIYVVTIEKIGFYKKRSFPEHCSCNQVYISSQKKQIWSTAYSHKHSEQFGSARTYTIDAHLYQYINHGNCEDREG